MSAPWFVVTQHAIDRYLQRASVAPDETREVVEQTIADESSTAQRQKERTGAGEWLFRLPASGLTLVCKRDKGRGAWLVVTILSEAETNRPSGVELDAEIAAEAEADRVWFAAQRARGLA